MVRCVTAGARRDDGRRENALPSPAAALEVPPSAPAGARQVVGDFIWRRRRYSLPLNRRRRLARDVVSHAVDAAHLVRDAPRNALRPTRHLLPGFGRLGCDLANYNDRSLNIVLISAIVYCLTSLISHSLQPDRALHEYTRVRGLAQSRQRATHHCLGRDTDEMLRRAARGGRRADRRRRRSPVRVLPGGLRASSSWAAAAGRTSAPSARWRRE